MQSDSRYPFSIEPPREQLKAPFWRWALAFGVGLYLAAELSDLLSVNFGSYVGFWLPAGIYMTGLLLAETRQWPWLALAALPGTLLFDARHGTRFWASLGFYAANSAQAFGGAWPIRRYIAKTPSFRNIKEFFGFVGFGAILSPAIGATLGAAVLVASGANRSYAVPWWTWWGSESIAILVVSPVILASFGPGRPTTLPRLRSRAALEAVAMSILILAAVLLVSLQSAGVNNPAKYLVLPLLLWAGLRFGVGGAAAANLLLGMMLGYVAARREAGMTEAELSASGLLLNFYAFLFVASLVSIAPAVVLRERDLLLARLRASEENLRLLLEGVQDCAIFMLDLEGNIASWTPAARRLTGYSADEAMGKPVSLLVPAEERDAYPIGTRLAQARDQGKSENEGWGARKDGSRFYSTCLITPLCDPLGVPRGYADIIRDVSVRKAWEMKLVEESRKNEALLQTAIDGIHIFDLDGNVVQVNEAFCRHLGYSREELLNMNVAQWEMQRSAQELRDHIRGIPPGGAVFETRHRRRDGTAVEVEISATWVTIDGKRHLYASARDITARKAMEEKLRQSQKLEAVGRLAGGIAHDFNNILTGMILNIEMIEMDRQLPQDVVQPFRDLKAMARRAAGITEQLLLFARKHNMSSEALELNGVLDNVLKMIARLLGEHIKVRLVRRAPALWVKGDPGMLDQVVMNISINARDSMPGGGEIKFETSQVEFTAETAPVHGEARAGRFACVSVSDTGTGIPEDILPQIFEPFFTTKEVGRGTGLGLATVDGIIHQHKGWVTVESVVGRGTTFRIYLPISEEVGVVAAASAQPAMSVGHERILLAEDEDGVRKIASLILKRLGYDVVAACDGAEALVLWESSGRNFDLLITDMVMPGGIGGLFLARRLREMKPSVKVVIMSGYNEQIVGSETFREEGFCFISKPFEMGVLAAVVQKALS